jgi:hypothetical protein
LGMRILCDRNGRRIPRWMWSAWDVRSNRDLYRKDKVIEHIIYTCAVTSDELAALPREHDGCIHLKGDGGWIRPFTHEDRLGQRQYCGDVL